MLSVACIKFGFTLCFMQVLLTTLMCVMFRALVLCESPTMITLQDLIDNCKIYTHLCMTRHFRIVESALPEVAANGTRITLETAIDICTNFKCEQIFVDIMDLPYRPQLNIPGELVEPYKFDDYLTFLEILKNDKTHSYDIETAVLQYGDAYIKDIFDILQEHSVVCAKWKRGACVVLRGVLTKRKLAAAVRDFILKDVPFKISSSKHSFGPFH